MSGCGLVGGGDDDESSPTDSAKPADALKLSVPAAFDAKGGWQSGVSERAFATASRDGLFFDVSTKSSPRASAQPSASQSESASPSPSSSSAKASSSPSASPSASKDKDGNPVADDMLVARAVTDGKVQWSSAPLLPLADQRGTEVRVIRTSQGEYVVVLRSGVVPASGVQRSRPVTVVDAFPAGLRGPDQAPAQHYEYDLVTDSQDSKAVIGDGGVLFPGRPDDGAERRVSPGVLWNPVTGATTPTPAGAFRPGGCDEGETCPVQDVPMDPTSAGLLTHELPLSFRPRFGLVGGWSSGDVIPKGSTWGEPVQAVGNVVVVAWHADARSSNVLYAAHNLRTGAMIASAACTWPFEDETAPEETVGKRATLSPQGRYLVVDSMAFDLSAGTAACVGGDDRTRGVKLISVGDNGVAYGTLLDDEDDEDDNVAVILASGKTEPLPAGAIVPQTVTASGAGVFLAYEDGNEDKPVVAVLPPMGTASASPSKN